MTNQTGTAHNPPAGRTADLHRVFQPPELRASARSIEMYLLNEALSREHQRQLERSARERRHSRQAWSERRYRARSARSR
jgi:hypothetical protein